MQIITYFQDTSSYTRSTIETKDRLNN